MKELSVVKRHYTPRQMSGSGAVQISRDAIAGLAFLDKIKDYGIDFSPNVLDGMIGSGMDAIEPMLSTPSISVPTQYLQTFMPGLIGYITAVLKAEEAIGLTNVGQWDDDKIVLRSIEHMGLPVRYSDLSNVPFANYNSVFETRDIIQFELGFKVGKMASSRASRINISEADEKRKGAAKALNIMRNLVTIFGYNANSRTFGILNDPGLLPMQAVPLNGGSTSTKWVDKTFTEIMKDWRIITNTLRTQTKGNVDPFSSRMTALIATDAYEGLSVYNDLGTLTVREAVQKLYPGIRFVDIPEFDKAHGGSSVMYLFAESIKDDVSTDDGATWINAVQTQFMTVGVKQEIKHYEEDYLNAMAGATCKRPMLVTSWYGIA